MKRKIGILTLFVLIFNILFACGLIFGGNAISNGSVKADGEQSLPASYCIRDEYYLPTQNQHNQGSCWAFASTTVFSTAVMKATNQYIDYSEGWLSARWADISGGVPGGAGTVYNFNGVTKEFGGILQEQDFNYEESYQVSQQNLTEMVGFYSQFLDRITPKIYAHTKFDVSANDTVEYRNTIKNHILTQSGFYVSCKLSVLSATISGKTVFYRNPTDSSTRSHALAVIGWDDNFSVTYSNTTYNGAWIMLNSYGNSDNQSNLGIVYLLYEDPYYDEFVGYTYQEQLDELYFYNKLTASTSTFTSDLKGACTNNFDVTQSATKQKNVFLHGDNVSLTYDYKISDDTEIDDIRIYDFQTDVTSNFNIVLNKTTKKIIITAKNSLDCSAYKVKFVYSNASNSEFVCGAFYVIDGTETEYIEHQLSSASYNDNNIKFQAINSSSTGQKHLIYSTQQMSNDVTLKVYMSTYSWVKQLKVKNMTTLEEITTELSDPSKYQAITFTNVYQNKNYQLSIIGKTATKVYDIHFLQFADTTQKFVTRINYYLDGGVNSPNNYKVMTTTNSTTLINMPTKVGCEFAGWYYSKDFDENTKLTILNGNYYLNHDNLIHYDTNNSYWKNSSSVLDFNSYNIYAKWNRTQEEQSNIIIDNNVPQSQTGSVTDILILVITVGVIAVIIAFVIIDSKRNGKFKKTLKE